MTIAERIDRATIQAERINVIVERSLDSTSAPTVQKLAKDIIAQQTCLSEELAQAVQQKPVTVEKDYGFCRTERTGDHLKITFKGKGGKLAAGIAVGGMLGLGVFALIRGLR